MMCILLFWFAVFKEVVAEPNLSQMSLILILSIDLFDGIEYFGLEVESFPHLRESSSSQLLSFKISINEGFIF
jgi:hypothetical protein